MSKLSSYLIFQLATATAVTIFILTGTLWIVESLKFFELALQSQESFSSLFSLMFFLLPDLFVIIAPLSAFIASLFVYNKLHSDRELSVLWSAGFSPWQLAKPAIKFGLFLTLLVYAINIFVLPWSFQQMRQVEHQLKKSLPGILLQEGVFNSFNDITIYVHKKEGQDLKGILAYLQKKGESPSTFMAKEGRLVLVDQTPRIIMVEGNRQEFNARTNSLSVLYFDQTVLTLFEKQLEHVERPKKPYELSLKEIFFLPNPHFKNHNLLYTEGLQRLLVPWYSVAFVLIGVTFLLRSPFSRKTQSKPIIKSIIGVLMLQVVSMTLINLSNRYWEIIGIAYTLVFLVILISISLLRTRKR